MLKKILKEIITGSVLGILILFVASPFPVQANKTVQVQFLVTSDMHGKFYPYDYVFNKTDTSGSCAQIATAVGILRDENTIVVDGGDIIQGNTAEVFLKDELHPMMLAMNDIKYDVWVTGNHEYDFGLPALQRIAKQNNGLLLCGNVYDPQGKRMAAPYAIVERGGVKIGIIGMVTPNIARWDKAQLKGWRVSNPVDETKAAIKELKGRVDLLVAVDHMTVENECSVSGSGVRDLAMACPELNLIIAAHGHQAIDDLRINGIPIIENKMSCKTLGQVLLNMEQVDGSWKLKETSTKLYNMGDYESDEKLLEKLKPYNDRAVAAANEKIGYINNNSLALAKNYSGDVGVAKIKETAYTDLIGEVMLHNASGAKVAAVGVYNDNIWIPQGDIKRYQASSIYPYENTIYTVEMTGKQLKKWMEFSAGCFNQYKPGDSSVSFNPKAGAYDYSVFYGIKYEMNISEPSGNRIQKLTWLDGTPIKDSDRFIVAVNNYDAESKLLDYGTMFKCGEELPKLVSAEIANGIVFRDLIADYIKSYKHGELSITADHNWRITSADCLCKMCSNRIGS